MPDLVLLVNGIPLVVVECKSPSVPEPLAEAIDQLRRYSNQRKAALEVDENEGNEALFATNQMLIASCVDEARVGCIGAEFAHFAQWKTVIGPDGCGAETDVAKHLGKHKGGRAVAGERCACRHLSGRAFALTPHSIPRFPLAFGSLLDRATVAGGSDKQCDKRRARVGQWRECWPVSRVQAR